MEDKLLRQLVIDELDFEPSVVSANIGVTADNGIITLSGHVPNFAQKQQAEISAKRIKGVRGVVDEIKVDFGKTNPFADEDIAKRALAVLDENVQVPRNAIQVKVQHGWLTLTGDVEWEYQRVAAMDDLRKLRGVVSITNAVKVKPHASAMDIKRRIEDSLKRSAEVEAKNVHVLVAGGKVTLEGKVDTWADVNTVSRAAWSAPGVSSVENHLHVS